MCLCRSSPIPRCLPAWSTFVTTVCLLLPLLFVVVSLFDLTHCCYRVSFSETPSSLKSSRFYVSYIQDVSSIHPHKKPRRSPHTLDKDNLCPCWVFQAASSRPADRSRSLQFQVRYPVHMPWIRVQQANTRVPNLPSTNGSFFCQLYYYYTYRSSATLFFFPSLCFSALVLCHYACVYKLSFPGSSLAAYLYVSVLPMCGH